MPTPINDTRSSARRERDEQISIEPTLAPLDLPAAAAPANMESHLRGHRPLAVAGIVENGLVRPLDLTVKLAEHSRVIIILAE